ncbi:uncharacterized protein LOC117189489 [Drosophila miranda]|uniref:uncharacterized protein LOC117189489 n=1 Tax=Drosophila miranda TaxID=7229 RepID=UPI00143F54EE|nr:uncharacterized protein LOC117189489 [Drosophila miranda]
MFARCLFLTLFVAVMAAAGKSDDQSKERRLEQTVLKVPLRLGLSKRQTKKKLPPMLLLLPSSTTACDFYHFYLTCCRRAVCQLRLGREFAGPGPTRPAPHPHLFCVSPSFLFLFHMPDVRTSFVSCGSFSEKPEENKREQKTVRSVFELELLLVLARPRPRPRQSRGFFLPMPLSCLMMTKCEEVFKVLFLPLGSLFTSLLIRALGALRLLLPLGELENCQSIIL